MKVIHLWRSDSGSVGGGAAISMGRLHSGLREAGIDSKILCQTKTTNSPYVQVLQFPKVEILNSSTHRSGR